MAVYIEDHLPVVKHNGLNTTKDTTISGAVTLSGNTTISGDLVMTGAVTGTRRSVVSGTDATYALTTAQSGTVFVATKSSATQTYTLPSAATAGVFFTFVCGHASGEILVTPQASQAIIITTFAAVGTDADTAIVAPTAGTGVKNTAATNAIGDNLTLVSDGTQWFGLNITGGIWASQ